MVMWVSRSDKLIKRDNRYTEISVRLHYQRVDEITLRFSVELIEKFVFLTNRYFFVSIASH